jgi:hypothetical protein
MNNLLAVVPQVSAKVAFIVSIIYVNLIPPLDIFVIPLKALAPILVTPSAEIEVKLIAPLKALAPIDLTVSGKVIELTLSLP